MAIREVNRVTPSHDLAMNRARPGIVFQVTTEEDGLFPPPEWEAELSWG